MNHHVSVAHEVQATDPSTFFRSEHESFFKTIFTNAYGKDPSLVTQHAHNSHRLTKRVLCRSQTYRMHQAHEGCATVRVALSIFLAQIMLERPTPGRLARSEGSTWLMPGTLAESWAASVERVEGHVVWISHVRTVLDLTF
jgi:hypothetical protein